MAVYFVKGSKSRTVKIGYTSCNIEHRVNGLRTGNPEELEIIRTYSKGTRDDESNFHKRFSRSRISREWFRYDPEIAIFLGDINGFDKVNLFKIRALEDIDLTKSSNGYLYSWLCASAEASYYKGSKELQDFFEDQSISKFLDRPLDDHEIKYLTRKRWESYAQKNS